MKFYRDGELVTATAAEASAITAAQNSAASRKIVPPSVTNFQARAVLLRHGLFDQANAMLEAGKTGTPEEQEAFQAWEFGNEFLRGSPTMARLGAGFGLSGDDIDDIFIEAATIEA